MLLVVAFAVQPTTDNLVTGYPVVLLLGVDALGELSVADVLGIAVVEVMLCFLLGYALGALLGQCNE